MDFTSRLRPDVVHRSELNRRRPGQQKLESVSGGRNAADANDRNTDFVGDLPDRMQRQWLDGWTAKAAVPTS